MSIGIEFEVEVDLNSKSLKVTVEAEAEISKYHYGADADGRRGEDRTELEDLAVTIFDGHKKDITKKIKEKYPKAFEAIEERAEQNLFSALESY